MRNAVYCCYRCNARKKNKLFVRWLTELSEPFCAQSRAIYVLKHEHQPEAFETGPYELRSDGVPIFLEYDDKEFERELRDMLPLSNEPPAHYLLDLLEPHVGPANIESLIFRRLPASTKNGT